MIFTLLLICCAPTTTSMVQHQYQGVRVGDAQITIKEVMGADGKMRNLGTKNLPLDPNLAKMIRLSANFTIFDIKSGEPIEAIQQAFLRFTHSKSADHQVYFVSKANKKQKGSYSLEIKMSRDIDKFKHRPGKYHGELIVGDSRVRDGLQWEMFDAFLDIPKRRQSEAQSYEPRKRDEPYYGTKPEIIHKFKKVESCNVLLWPLFYFFAIFCGVPLIVLLYHWLPLMLNAIKNLFPPSNGTYSGPIFHNLLIALFTLYSMCWLLGINLAYMLQFSFMLIVPLFLAGHAMLKNIATERMEREEEEENQKIVLLAHEEEYREGLFHENDVLASEDWQHLGHQQISAQEDHELLTHEE